MTQQRRTNRGPGAAAENRAALLAAAREVFAASGFDAPLYAVARAAGVGQAVLYRHFPDRLALALAVFEDNMQALEEMVTDASVTLDDLLRRVADYTVDSTAFIDMLAPVPDDRLLAVEQRMRALIDGKLDAARRSGLIAPDVTVDDVMLALTMLSGAMARVLRADRPQTADRVLALLDRAWAPR
ncbi:TetR/AcrR family transcriptional regulator [Winogradskya humida]|uniref:TetR family transcriptional regulator n=1 Tax=Winogradskya humida TaxID=113566 RepID=A0ABQ4A6B8_9ACTN|nr:helix-turn-helix domain-containing protein [Actinoplanes humidus]GIE26386.1 TetR family transcriptional regulator [Actinoplanes humidus]